MNASAGNPIGVFDSGIGGLSVLDVLLAEFPHEDFVYLGDTAHMPYGSRSQPELAALVTQNLDWLLETHQVKFLVVACNTARSALRPENDGDLKDPLGRNLILGPISPISQWLGDADLKRVGVFATPATVASEIYPRLIRQFNSAIKVQQITSPDLAHLVESGHLRGPLVEHAIGKALETLLPWNPEALILGCTHYPFVRRVIEELLPKTIQVLDPADFMADTLKERLAGEGLLNARTQEGSLKFYVTGEPDIFKTTVQLLPLKQIRLDRVSLVLPATLV